jgi:lipoprotein-releasing system ATP-binding protein
MSENRPAILQAQGLRKTFRSGQEDLVVLDGLELQVPEGGTVVISGESGSGKSTLLNLIGGLDAPSAGRIFFRDSELTGRSEAELQQYRARSLGFIFQLHFLLKDFTALENVLLPALILGLPSGQARARAERLLAQVGLDARRQHYPTELSGGERQRVAVARALMNDPELILADEPTGNLDERSSSQVRELLFGLVAEYRKTLVLVTHATDLASAGESRYVLEHGRLRSA